MAINSPSSELRERASQSPIGNLLIKLNLKRSRKAPKNANTEAMHRSTAQAGAPSVVVRPASVSVAKDANSHELHTVVQRDSGYHSDASKMDGVGKSTGKIQHDVPHVVPSSSNVRTKAADQPPGEQESRSSSSSMISRSDVEDAASSRGAEMNVPGESEVAPQDIPAPASPASSESSFRPSRLVHRRPPSSSDSNSSVESVIPGSSKPNNRAQPSTRAADASALASNTSRPSRIESKSETEKKNNSEWQIQPKDEAIFDTKIRPCIRELIRYVLSGSDEEKKDSTAFDLELGPSRNGKPELRIKFKCSNGNRKKEIERLMSSIAFQNLLGRYPKFNHPPIVVVDPELGFRGSDFKTQDDDILSEAATGLPEEPNVLQAAEKDSETDAPLHYGAIPMGYSVSGSTMVHSGARVVHGNIYHYDTTLPNQNRQNPWVHIGENIKRRLEIGATPREFPNNPENPSQPVGIVLSPDADTLCGANLLLEGHSKSGHKFTLASTCTGIVLVDNYPFALTTGHALTTINRRMPDYQEGAIDPWELQYPPRHLGNVEAYCVTRRNESSIGGGDWMLVDVLPGLLRPNSFLEYWKGEKPTQKMSCVIITASDNIKGNLIPGFSSMNLNGVEFKAARIDLKSPCQPGDSGAPVVLAEQNKMFGVVVGASDNPPRAYVMMFEDVLRNISQLTGLPVRLPEGADNAMFSLVAQISDKETLNLSEVSESQSEAVKDTISMALRRAVTSPITKLSYPLRDGGLLSTTSEPRSLEPKTYTSASSNPFATVANVCSVAPSVRARLRDLLLLASNELGAPFQKLTATRAGENIIILVYALSHLASWSSITEILSNIYKEVDVPPENSASYRLLEQLVDGLRKSKAVEVFAQGKYFPNICLPDQNMASESPWQVAKNLVLLSMLGETRNKVLFIYDGPYGPWYFNYAEKILGIYSWKWDFHQRSKEPETAVESWYTVGVKKDLPRVHICERPAGKPELRTFERAARLVVEDVLETVEPIYRNRALHLFQPSQKVKNGTISLGSETARQKPEAESTKVKAISTLDRVKKMAPSRKSRIGSTKMPTVEAY